MANELYTDLATVRLALTIKDDDTSRDPLITKAIAAASRSIDNHTGRRFSIDDTATTRTFPAHGRVVRDSEGELLLVDDIADIADMVVETGSGSTWTAVDAAAYETHPFNAAVFAQPVTGLRSFTNGWSWTPQGRVRITARWGWPAVPDVVEQAALIQTMRLFKRKDSPEGVTGNAEWGVVRLSRIDPDVQALIQHLVLPGFG